MGRRNRKNIHGVRKMWMNIGFIVGAFVLVLFVIFMIVLPPSKGKINQFSEENSISEKTKITIEDGDIGLYILGHDASKPVLLVCGGGPGIPQYLMESMYPSVLPEYFVVCYFDYRGCGLSYDSKYNPEDMSIDRYLKDVYAITGYLKERFNQEKIYIMGHSFGSIIALKTIKKNPSDYVAYLAVSQSVNQKESEYLAYDYMVEEYKKMKNTRLVNKLTKYDIRKSDEALDSYFGAGIRDKAMHDLGLGTARDMKNVISGIFFPSLRNTQYTIKERINIWKGKVNSNSFKTKEEIFKFNAMVEIPSVEIPIYFFAGEYDYTCCQSLQREYYDLLAAPVKEYYLYSDTAHSPVYEDKERTREILENIVSKYQ